MPSTLRRNVLDDERHHYDDAYHLSCQEYWSNAMRVSRNEMDANHRRVVEGTSRVMRAQGVKGVSVASAMSQAGMTHGGFYRHFATKEDLVLQAVRWAFDEFVSPLEHRAVLDRSGTVAREFRQMYLSQEHVANPTHGCPMPALATDALRGCEEVRAEFAKGVTRVVAALTAAQPLEDDMPEATAAREVAMLVGALVLARATGGDTAKAILDACRVQGDMVVPKHSAPA